MTQGIFGELYVNLQEDTFRALAFYLNTRQLHCSEIHLPDLLAEAARLNLPGLVALCEQKLSSSQYLRKTSNGDEDQTKTLPGGDPGHEFIVSAVMSNELISDTFAETDAVSTVNHEDETAQHPAIDRTEDRDQQRSATAASASAQAMEVPCEPFQGPEVHQEDSVSELDGGAVEEADEQNEAAKSQSMVQHGQQEEEEDTSNDTTPGSASSDDSSSGGSAAAGSTSLTSAGSTSNAYTSTETDASELSSIQVAESCQTVSTSTRTTSAGERFREAVARRLNTLPTESSSSKVSWATQVSPRSAPDEPQPEAAELHGGEAESQRDDADEQDTVPIQSTETTSPTSTATANLGLEAGVQDLNEEQRIVESDKRSYSGERFKAAVARRLKCAAAAESRVGNAGDTTTDESQPPADVGGRPSLRELARQRCYLYAPDSGRDRRDGVEQQDVRSNETTGTTTAAATADATRSTDAVQGPRDEQHPDDPNQAVISVKEVIEHFEAVTVGTSNNNRSAPPVHPTGVQGRPHLPWAVAYARRQRELAQAADDSVESTAAPANVNAVRERGLPATRMPRSSAPAAATTDVVNHTAIGRRPTPSGSLITFQSLYGPWKSDEEQQEPSAQGVPATAANVAPVVSVGVNDVFSDDASTTADSDVDQADVRGRRDLPSTGGAHPNPKTERELELMW
ncbi:hypothetical protein AAVH_05609 [Aphelenchoides avenae]|nr:hypothetical protein AAVH_05609 [Aphelenchus avenae]